MWVNKPEWKTEQNEQNSHHLNDDTIFDEEKYSSEIGVVWEQKNKSKYNQLAESEALIK